MQAGGLDGPPLQMKNTGNTAHVNPNRIGCVRVRGRICPQRDLAGGRRVPGRGRLAPNFVNVGRMTGLLRCVSSPLDRAAD